MGRNNQRKADKARRCRVSFRGFILSIILALAAAGPTWAGGGSPPVAQSSVEPAGQTAPPSLKLIQRLPAPGEVGQVIWSSDGSKIAAFSFGQPARLPGIITVPSPFAKQITIWNADGTLFRSLIRNEPFMSVSDTFAFVAGDTEIAAPPSIYAKDIAFSIFDIYSGKIVREIASQNTGRGVKIIASPDQTSVAVIFNQAEIRPVALYSTKDWTKLDELPLGPTRGAAYPIGASFAPDRRHLAVLRMDGVVLVYDLNSKQIVRTIDSFPDISGAEVIAFSPDSTMIAIGSFSNGDFSDGSGKDRPIKNPVRLFNIKNGSTVAVYTEPFLGVQAMAWSPDSRFVAFVTGNGLLHVWSPFQAKTTEWKTDLHKYVDSIAFSPDGGRLAVGDGQTVKIFSVAH
jgi:WD40 repeat protein